MANKFMPWFVAAAVIFLIGTCVYVTSLQPVTGYEIFLVLMISGSGAGVIMGYFRMNAIFNRMEQRCQEWNK